MNKPSLFARVPVSRILAIAFALLPALALAHSNDDQGGFLAGLWHPVSGFDHMLAMVSVGILSALIGRWHIWLVPVVFVTAMLCGALMGIYQLPLPYGECWIAVSVFALGLSIAANHKGIPLVIIYAFMCIFGASHGYAHGLEMPRSASPAFFSFGFIISTSALHLLGVGIGEIAVRQKAVLKGLRVVGGSISVAGVWFLTQALGVLG